MVGIYLHFRILKFPSVPFSLSFSLHHESSGWLQDWKPDTIYETLPKCLWQLLGLDSSLRAVRMHIARAQHRSFQSHLKLAYEIYESKIWVVCWTCEIPCACKATWINARQVCSSRWLIQMLLWYYGQSISQFSIWHVDGASASWEKVECCDASTQCVFEEDTASGTKQWPTQVAGSITWKHSALLSILTVGLRLNMAKQCAFLVVTSVRGCFGDVVLVSFDRQVGLLQSRWPIRVLHWRPGKKKCRGLGWWDGLGGDLDMLPQVPLSSKAKVPGIVKWCKIHLRLCS
jgi:hypothetical protein